MLDQLRVCPLLCVCVCVCVCVFPLAPQQEPLADSSLSLGVQKTSFNFSICRVALPFVELTGACLSGWYVGSGICNSFIVGGVGCARVQQFSLGLLVAQEQHVDSAG